MFAPWIRKKALKRKPRKQSKRLVIDGERPNVIALVSVTGLLVAVGIFVLQRTLAAPQAQPGGPIIITPEPSPLPTDEVSPSPSVSPTPSVGP
jgi:hypothetical protein